MGEIYPVRNVKGIFGVLYRDASIFHEALGLIEACYGPVDILSDEFPFVETEYYAQEMGEILIRRYFSLRDLIPPDALASIKVQANAWEEQFALNGMRQINLDPGYVGEANLVLASTKNFSQRIYLGQGIYAEVTMLYMHGNFTKLGWTYPDYYNHRDVFVGIRKRYRQQLDAEWAVEQGD